MCSECGCGSNEVSIDGHHHHSHAPHTSDTRKLRIEVDILAKNNAYAQANRQAFQTRGLRVVNLMSSPGSGKTTLLTRTIERLQAAVPVAVIEGDQQTTRDADRIRATGAPAVQVNTGKGCHLDAHMVQHAMGSLDPADGSLVFIENVGNLVCPAGFDLGEAKRVVMLSVTEGEDKPLKYPDIFHAADIILLTKIDLLPYVDFDVEQCISYARRLRPDIPVLQLSARSGAGMDRWCAWLQQAWPQAARTAGTQGQAS